MLSYFLIFILFPFWDKFQISFGILERITEIFKMLYRKKLLKKDAIVVCEYVDETIEEEYFDIIKSKNYGYKKVGIYVQKK